MSKPRTIIENIIFKTSKKELCNWLHFTYLCGARIKIYPYLGKPITGYMAKSPYKSLSLPKGKSQLVFTKTKGGKNGKPIDFDNIKVIGFPNRMDTKVQEHLYARVNELGTTIPSGVSCWSLTNNLLSKIRRYSGSTISLTTGVNFTFADYGYYIVDEELQHSSSDTTFSKRKKDVEDGIIEATKNQNAFSSVVGEEIKGFCDLILPTYIT